MREQTKRVAKLLQNEYPEVFRSSQNKIVDSCVFFILWELGLELPEHLRPLKTVPSIDLCEQLYERGYEAIINDGKLLGFRRIKIAL